MTMIRVLRTAWVVLAAVLLIVGGAVGASARASTVAATSFASSGDEIAGWFWVRSAGDTASWTFDTADLAGARPRSVYLNVTALVTNGVSGGSGYSATAVKFKITCGSQAQRLTANLVNPFRPIDPSDSGGVGYTAYGNSNTFVSTSRLAGCSTFTVTTSFPYASGRHIAFNQESVVLGYSS